YALPVTRRRQFLLHPADFADAYLEAFRASFLRVQEEYRRRRRAFDTLFVHLPDQNQGSFPYRWKRALLRLDQTDANELTGQIRASMSL
ncbi:MAG TPA: hypothetical protein VHE79_03215, partial [Spirochaetia bacterium]